MKLPFTGRASASAPFPLPDGRAGETKSTPLVALELARQASFTAPDFASLCREGFANNPVVYRCVRMIAESAASVPLTGAQLPNGAMEALERFHGYLQVAGAAYLQAVVLDGDVVALRALRPDTVKALGDAQGRPAGYEVAADLSRSNRGRAVHRRDPLTGRCAVMGLALFNPMDEANGQSPLRAAATSVDLHNQGTRWAKGLLDNSARPSGALVYDGAGTLTREQLESMKAELEQGFTGPARAGRPMVLEGGLDWKTMGMSPSDMDFTQGRREAARDIALAFGVPPMLLGIPGDNTYANYAEANRAFWRQTVLPLVARTARALSVWLSAFGEEAALSPDLDAVPALSGERSALWARLEAASFLDEDERRAFAGLPPHPKHNGGTIQ
ncbi:phage portal protein [uncultured Algimonas sp.]|uniref:phage portal protein n=1 Tax=uncultured Algimonas sp. TaxID=1547920 RepID=UPI002612EDF3|nr:phage portal protein [uncultured Algimonas sp.]